MIEALLLSSYLLHSVALSILMHSYIRIHWVDPDKWLHSYTVDSHTHCFLLKKIKLKFKKWWYHDLLFGSHPHLTNIIQFIIRMIWFNFELHTAKYLWYVINNKYIYKAQKTKGFYALYMAKHNVQYKIHTFI